MNTQLFGLSLFHFSALRGSAAGLDEATVNGQPVRRVLHAARKQLALCGFDALIFRKVSELALLCFALLRVCFESVGVVGD